MTTAPPVPQDVRADCPSRRVVVVGAGIAGLQTALVLRRRDPRCDVVLVSKAALAESNTRYAQGGIAAVLPDAADAAAPVDAAGPGPGAPQDSVEAHIADTLAAGAGLADPDAVEVLCRGAADGIDALQRAGVVFDRAPGRDSLPARGREAAHSAARILHLGGDATGAGLVDALVGAVHADTGIRVVEHGFVGRILLDDAGRATGVEVLTDGAPHRIGADAVVLATGGAGQLFEHTTNPAIATGDGVALAWRAGAAVADLEFFQFHPTSLDVPGNPLISEAVRGEGARLVDADGRRFMPDYHPDGDLAPRDVVSRSIARHLARRPSGTADVRNRVYLDATALGATFLARRFPSLTDLTAHHGYDWSAVVVPVVPAAHYWMGGVRTDTDGRTSVPGLFAVGEVARTGVHGANRLASNSLLEGVVFGARCAAAIVHGGRVPEFDAEPLDLDVEETGTQSFTRRDLQALMSDHAGILRTGSGLAVARKHLASYRSDTDPGTANLLLCARLLVHSAAHRTGSCGAHYRSDQPETAPGRPAPSRSYVRAPEGTP
ncbi:L-aspartate oxidase [Arthrobacter burdickii]|uniref:L-aspartate oxidase n=1 Tax=Arthrobacter burdickii TaxID=3035920 RepID=A0ABT8K194_9MICC|nr:L-aspartate oxidase [Arthrobacter burdickii]MDN4611198.1 L-aspartate oxidase [Arthrobacter burdickii]